MSQMRIQKPQLIKDILKDNTESQNNNLQTSVIHQKIN